MRMGWYATDVSEWTSLSAKRKPYDSDRRTRAGASSNPRFRRPNGGGPRKTGLREAVNALIRAPAPPRTGFPDSPKSANSSESKTASNAAMRTAFARSDGLSV